jgi:hypothetical protein
VRILRGKSNLEVSSQGFALFVLGLILATFFGGAVKTYLGSDDVQRRIINELRTALPNHQLEIERAEVLLSRGSLPGMGLRLHGVTLTQDVCGKLSFILTMPSATLPVDLFSVVMRKPRLGHVKIEKGQMHLDFRACEAPQPVSSVATGGALSPIPAAVAAEVPKPVIVPKIKVGEIRRFLKSVQFRDFSITYEKQPSWKVILKSGELEAGDEIGLQASVDVQKAAALGILVHPIELDLRSDRSVFKWDISSEFKEGHVHLTGSLDQETQGGRAALNLRLVPVKELMSEAYQMDLLTRELVLKSTWISCAAEWEGSLLNFKAAPISIHDCIVEGGYGRAELAKTDLWLNAEEPFKTPAKFKIRQMQIQPVVEALGREVLPAVLSRLGVWSGELEYSNNKAWRLDGILENAEVIFSNQSVRGKQTITQVHTALKKQGSVISAKIDDVKLRDGVSEGTVDLILDDDWRNGRFSAKISSLALSPPVQKLLMGGSFSPVQLHGEGVLKAGEVSEWNGLLKLTSAEGVGWKAADMTVKSRYADGTFFLDAGANLVSASNQWRHFAQIATLMSEGATEATWTEVLMKVSVLKTGGQIESFSAKPGAGEPVWQGKAAWVRDGVFNGVLKAGKARSYSVLGEKGTLRILAR